MLGYAYLDKGNILHIVTDLDTAKQYAKSKIIETFISYAHGFPVYAGERILVYSPDKVVYKGNHLDTMAKRQAVNLWIQCAEG